MSSSSSLLALSDSDPELEKQKCLPPEIGAPPPSGLSNLLNNSERPLNAFVITSIPPPLSLYTYQQHISTPSSVDRTSSAYFTASQPNSISAVTNEDWASATGSTTMQTPSSEYDYLSRTISSGNYFDNHSDYEVILDDGTRQKRTISLSTVQLVSSKQPQQQEQKSFLDDWISSASSKFRNNIRRNHHIKSDHNGRKITEEAETARLIPAVATHDTLKNDNDQQTSLYLSSDSEQNSDDDSNSSSSDNHDEHHHHTSSPIAKRKRHHHYHQNDRLMHNLYKSWSKFRNQYLTLSHKQKMVLKCSFAYTIGSLFTFVPCLNALTGNHIASHMAATVTVFFNPAKSVGGMVEAAGFGWLYTLAALTLSLASMYTTDYFLENHMVFTAMLISLGVWLAGSTFVISYLKARINTPSVLTASGLAFIILFTVIVRQGSGIEAEFDFAIITETFFIVAIGTIISVSVCVLIWPMSASKKLKSSIDSSLSSTRILLKLLTKTFLLDTDLPEFTANKTLETALKAHRTTFTSLKAALKDAKLEFYNLEMRQHADGYHKIVKSMERLAQHIGGLKSSCGLQVEVMQQMVEKGEGFSSHRRQSFYGAIPSPNLTTNAPQKIVETYNLKAGPQRKRMESELKRERETSQKLQKQQEYSKAAAASSSSASHFDIISDESRDSKTLKQGGKNVNSAASGQQGSNSKEGALVQFIRTVRPPMKSLAYTCKQTIVHLQARFLNKTTQTTPSFTLMRQNLTSAMELFEESQHQALIRFYQRQFKTYHHKIAKADLHTLLLTHQQQFPADDIFLVYFFVFCLLEFAKELMILVESVQSVFEDMEESDKSDSVFAWARYLFGGERRKKREKSATDKSTKIDDEDIFIPNNHNTLNTLHTPAPKTRIRKFFLMLWGFFSGFKTYQVRFAMKSMLTAELISVLAFIPATRPYFTSFKMEWTLITVMAVMTPTVGGTNLGAVLRVIATILGCVLAAIIYTIFQNNTFMLWFMTWLISIPSFWMILHHKHGRFGLFTLLAYNLVVLFKFSHRDDDCVNVFELTWMRCVAVSLGVIIGLFVTAYVWPYEARTEVRKGLSDLLLRFSWLYKQLVSAYSEDSEEISQVYHNEDTVTSLQGYLRHVEHHGHHPSIDTTLLARRNKARAKGLQKIELSIQLGIIDLQALLVHAPNEPRLKGPFPAEKYAAMLTCCQNILDKLLALRIVILKDVWAIHVRHHFLLPASHEFMEMAGNVFLYFYLLASALQLKTPLPPYLPPAEKTRQTLMRKLQQLPLVMMEEPAYQQQLQMTEERKDECYMVYYAYVVLMENIIRELDSLGGHMKELFGSLVPDDQWARCFGQQQEQQIDLEQSQFHNAIGGVIQ